MSLTCLKWFSLKDQYRLQITLNMLRWLEQACALKLLYAEFKHVQSMAIKNTPKNKIIRPFFLMAADCKETAVIFHCLILD